MIREEPDRICATGGALVTSPRCAPDRFCMVTRLREKDDHIGKAGPMTSEAVHVAEIAGQRVMRRIRPAPEPSSGSGL